MTQTTTLIATARNEGPFLLEWIAYHRVIGFDRIIVMSDISVDGSDVLLSALHAAEAITYIPNAAPNAKNAKGYRNKAYAHALTLPQVQSSDWVAALDIDEYLNIHTGDGTVQALLAAIHDLGPTDVISPQWRVFGNAGLADYADRSLLRTLTLTRPDDTEVHDKHLGLKSMFRPGPVVRIGPHRPQLNEAHVSGQLPTVWRNGSGEDVTSALLLKGWAATAQTRGAELAQINHYMIRGNATFALHHLMDPPLGGDQNPMSVADHRLYNINQVSETSITRWADATTAEVNRLRAIPDIDQAHQNSVELFQSLITGMKTAAAADPVSEITPLLSDDMAQAILQAQSDTNETDTNTTLELVDPDDIAPQWLSDLRRSNHRRGWYYSDDTYAVQMTTRSSDTLIVSFDNLSDVTNPALGRNSWGYSFYRSEGWSHMGVMAFEKNWFRDERLFDFLQNQAKAGVFKRFKHVVMIGTSMGAYAATAFADLVPGCTVLAFSPQATLDPELVPWEKRFGGGRKQDWSGRFRHAPDHCSQAGAVFIVSDPYFDPDRQHAIRYQGPNIHHLKSGYATHYSALFLRRIDMLKPGTEAAALGQLTPALYYKMYRARRQLPWYINNLADHAMDKGHPKLVQLLTNFLSKKGRSGLAKEIQDRMP